MNYSYSEHVSLFQVSSCHLYAARVCKVPSDKNCVVQCTSMLCWGRRKKWRFPISSCSVVACPFTRRLEFITTRWPLNTNLLGWLIGKYKSEQKGRRSGVAIGFLSATAWGRVLPDTVTVSKLVKKKIPRMLWNPKVYYHVTSIRHVSLSWARLIQPMPPPPAIPLLEAPF
jgi:hypothetical protein